VKKPRISGVQKARILVLAILLLGAIAWLIHRNRQQSYSGFWVVPVRVHLLRASQLPAANCALNSQNVHRIFTKSTKIWRQARIELEIESIIEEEAANQDRTVAEGDQVTLANVKSLCPASAGDAQVIHVYYLGRMASNGVFQGLDAIFVQEESRLRPVAGGIDEPLPRVTAHELGHAFGLPHREAVTNLMASGTTGVALDAGEIEIARQTVGQFSFARKSPEIAVPQ
jgi:hypothetical protein